jgi:hypothetical protein
MGQGCGSLQRQHGTNALQLGSICAISDFHSSTSYLLPGPRTASVAFRLLPMLHTRLLKSHTNSRTAAHNVFSPALLCSTQHSRRLMRPRFQEIGYICLTFQECQIPMVTRLQINSLQKARHFQDWIPWSGQQAKASDVLLSYAILREPLAWR